MDGSFEKKIKPYEILSTRNLCEGTLDYEISNSLKLEHSQETL